MILKFICPLDFGKLLMLFVVQINPGPLLDFNKKEYDSEIIDVNLFITKLL